MPLSDSVLSAAIRAQILSKPSGDGHLRPQDTEALTELCDAIAAAVVAHIVTNAVVLPTTAGVPTLISPGGLTPAPVTGAGSIT